MSIKTLIPIYENDMYGQFNTQPYWTLKSEEKLEVLRLKLNEIIEALQEEQERNGGYE